MPRIPHRLNYTLDTRTEWAMRPYGAGPTRSYGTLSTTQTKPNPYAQYALGPGWGRGNFAIDMDKFLRTRYPDEPQFKEGNTRATYHLNLLGCHGVDTQSYAWFFTSWNAAYAQRAVMRHMEASDNPAMWNFLLGDNFYHFGVTAPDDSLFEKCFHRHVKTPSWVALGNHDYNIHSHAEKGWHKIYTSLYRAMCQVMHSYLRKPTDGQQTSNWNMPFRYYVNTSKNLGIHFFTIDSNTIVFDMEQQKWLIAMYKKLNHDYPGFKCILISHHPLKYYSKRQYKGLKKDEKPEWKKYVQPGAGIFYNSFRQTPSYFEQLELPENASLMNPNNMKKIPNTTKTDDISNETTNNTIGKCLQFLLQRYNLKFAAMFCAHEHLLAYEQIKLKSSTGETWTTHQIISGGGGAELNDALTALMPAKGKGFIVGNYGYFRVEIKPIADPEIPDAKRVSIQPYIIPGNRYTFPIQKPTTMQRPTVFII